MNKFLLLAIIFLSTVPLFGQGFEIINSSETHKGYIGDIIKAPLKFKNTTDRPIILIVRKVTEQIGSTQKSYFCVDDNCLDQRTEDFIIKIEAGQTLTTLQIALEAGLVPGLSSIRYLAYNKSNPSQALEFDLEFSAEEKREKQDVYTSKFISIKEVYPNPVSDYAYVDYKIQSDAIKAKILLHNLLGNVISEYELPPTGTSVRMKADDLSPGIYFYTLYIDNEGVMTRKLIVKK